MAFGLQIKRKARLATVLQSQQIQFQKPFILSHAFTRKILIAPFGILIFLGFLYLFHLFKKATPSELNLSHDNYRILFEGEFSESLKAILYERMGTTLKELPRFEALADLAKVIQKKEGFAQVHIFLTPENKLIVTLKPRIPIMRLSENGNKVISKDAEIYEDSNFKPKFQTILTGIPLEDSALTKKDKIIIYDAINLLELAEKNSLHFTSIEYKKYRGFFAKVENSNLNIVFGFPPFTQQFTRLGKIQEEAKKSHKNLEYIEVDYADKAFIKESRL